MIHANHSQLGKIADITIGMAIAGEEATGPGQPVLTVRCLTDGRIDPSQITRFCPGNRPVDQYRLQTGDVLLPARSTSLKMAIVPPEWDGAIINATLIRIRCGDRLDPRLLVAYMSHPSGRAEVEACSQSGTLQLNLTVRSLRSLEIPLPPIEEQARLVELMEAADDAYRSAVDAAQRRHRSANEVVLNIMTGRQRPLVKE